MTDQELLGDVTTLVTFAIVLGLLIDRLWALWRK